MYTMYVFVSSDIKGLVALMTVCLEALIMLERELLS